MEMMPLPETNSPVPVATSNTTSNDGKRENEFPKSRWFLGVERKKSIISAAIGKNKMDQEDMRDLEKSLNELGSANRSSKMKIGQ